MSKLLITRGPTLEGNHTDSSGTTVIFLYVYDVCGLASEKFLHQGVSNSPTEHATSVQIFQFFQYGSRPRRKRNAPNPTHQIQRHRPILGTSSVGFEFSPIDVPSKSMWVISCEAQVGKALPGLGSPSLSVANFSVTLSLYRFRVGCCFKPSCLRP